MSDDAIIEGPTFVKVVANFAVAMIMPNDAFAVRAAVEGIETLVTENRDSIATVLGRIGMVSTGMQPVGSSTPISLHMTYTVEPSNERERTVSVAGAEYVARQRGDELITEPKYDPKEPKN